MSMKVLLELKVENLFKSKDFPDKQTGEVKLGKWKVQTFNEKETEQGSQLKLFDVSITENQYLKYKDSVGKVITISVGVYVNKNNNQYGFYGID